MRRSGILVCILAPLTCVLLVGARTPAVAKHHAAAAAPSASGTPFEIGTRGGRFTLAVTSDPRTFNPILAAEASSIDVTERLFAALADFDNARQQYVPALAQNWELSPDGRTCTWHLRHDARFSDGHPLTSADVLFSRQVAIDMHMTGTGAGPRWSGLVAFSRLDAMAGRIRLTLDEAKLTFGVDEPTNPTLALTVNGAVYGEPFTTHFTGPLSHLLRDTICAPPLTDAAIRDFIIGVRSPPPGAVRGSFIGTGNPQHTDDARFSLRVPAILSGGAEVFDWPTIGDPPPVAK